MHIIIKDIPPSLTIQALETEVLGSVKWKLFQPKKTQIHALKIIQLVDAKGTAVERFALIRVSTDNMKKRLLKSLNGRPMINGRPFILAEYIIRHWSNDRRTNSAHAVASIQNDKRHYDRRRRGLNLVTFSEKSVIHN